MFAPNFLDIIIFIIYFNTIFMCVFCYTFLEKPIILNMDSKNNSLDEKISIQIDESVKISCDIFEESIGSDTKVIWSLNGLPINSNAQGYQIFVIF